MNRFTKRTPDNFGYCEYLPKGITDEYDCVQLLGRYEDTELTPDEIELLKAKAKRQEDELKIVYELADKMSKAIFNDTHSNRDTTFASIEYEDWRNAGTMVNEDYE